MAFRFLSSGESHGPELNIIVEGLPANMPLKAEDIDRDLARRQMGYGRGGRMKIETDRVIFTGGIRHGRCFGGAPLAMKLINKDHQKWLNVMNAAAVDEKDPEVAEQLAAKYISKVRPGHADLAGAIKYNAPDVRDILERSSARETTSRVAAGAAAKKLLSLVGIQIFSHVVKIGAVTNPDAENLDHKNLKLAQFMQGVDSSEFRIYDPGKTSEELSPLETKFKKHVDEIRKAGDTLGGLLEVFAVGVPIGLGTHVQWERRLDGRIAQALLSTHTVKSVEFGAGTAVAQTPGSQVHDQIYLNPDYKQIEDIEPSSFFSRVSKSVLENSGNNISQYFRYHRKTNRLGGFEGGMTNGEPISCRVAVKPIPTLVSTLDSIDLATQKSSESHFERSDVCVVPAAGVVLESMMAIAIAEAFLEKFAGDSMLELANSYFNYLKQINLK